MGSLFSSKSKSSSVSSVKIPSNFQNLMDRTIKFANEGLDTPFTSYEAPRIADLSANEQAGIAGAGANAGMYQDLIDMASMNNAAMQVQGGVPTQGDLNAFMNPYVDYVLGNTLNRLQEQSDINMTKIGSTAGMSGAFGGLRHGVLEGANLSELLKSAQEASANTYSDAFDKGIGNWFRSQDLRRGTISDALNIAQGGQAYNLNDINALMQTGLTERTRNQSVLDFAYSEFLREQGDPYTKANFASSVLSSYPTDLFTRTNVTTQTQTPSPFSQIAGVGLAAAGLMTGNPAALAGLGAGASSLGQGTPISAPMGGVNITPVAGGSRGNYYTNDFLSKYGRAKGGLIKGYNKGGKVKKDKVPVLKADKTPYKVEADPLVSAVRKYQILPDLYKDSPWVDLVTESPAETPTFFDKDSWIAQLLGDTLFSEEDLLKLNKDKPTRQDIQKLEDMDQWLATKALQRQKTAKQLESPLSIESPLDDPQKKKEILYTLEKLIDENRGFNTVPQDNFPTKYAKGGKVKKENKYFLGGLLALDYNQKGTPESRAGIFNRGDSGQVAPVSTPRPAFDWGAFMNRHGLQSFQTPQFPNAATPRLPARGPDLSMFVQALRSKLGAGMGQQSFAEGGGVKRKYENNPLASAMQDAVAQMEGEDITDLLPEGEPTNVIPAGYEAGDRSELDKLIKSLGIEEKGSQGLDIDNFEQGLFNLESKQHGWRSLNKDTKAFGRYQFLPDTWNEDIQKLPKKTREDLGIRPVNKRTLEKYKDGDDDLLKVLPSPAQQRAVYRGVYLPRSIKALEKNGLDVTPQNLYLAHHFGQKAAPGMIKAIQDNPRISIKDALKAGGYEDATIKRIINTNNLSGKRGTGEGYFADISRRGKWGGSLPAGKVRNIMPETMTADLMDLLPELQDLDTDSMAAIRRKEPPVIIDGKPTFNNPLEQIPVEVEDLEPLSKFIKGGLFPKFEKGGSVRYPDRSEMIKSEDDIANLLMRASEGWRPVYDPEAKKNVWDNEITAVQSIPLLEKELNKAVKDKDDYLIRVLTHDLNKARRYRDYPSKFSGGGYVKGYAKGDLIKMPDGSYRRKDGSEVELSVLEKAINNSRQGAGLSPLADNYYGDFDLGDAAAEAGRRAEQPEREFGELWEQPWRTDSRVGRGLETLARGAASIVPFSGSVLARGAQGGLNALDFLFGDMTKENKPATIKAPTPKTNSPFGTLRMDSPNYGQPTAETFNVGLEEGEPSAPLEQEAQAEIAQAKEDTLSAALREMIMQEIEERKKRQEPDENKLFGMNVNMPLIKMGLGILANSGYPNSAGEAIGKGVLGALEGEEQKRLQKQERDSAKLQELVKLRFMQAQVEAMDPNIKMQLQREKAVQEAAFDKMKSDQEFQQWLRKQPYNEEMQKRLIEFRAKIAAEANNPFADIGEGRTDLSGE